MIFSALLLAKRPRRAFVSSASVIAGVIKNLMFGVELRPRAAFRTEPFPHRRNLVAKVIERFVPPDQFALTLSGPNTMTAPEPAAWRVKSFTSQAMRFTYLALIAASLLSAQTASSQLTTAEEKGLPPNSVFHLGDIDAINLQNGNLHISIPIASSKQRGGTTLTWSLVYDTPSWTKTWFPNYCEQTVPHDIIVYQDNSHNPPPLPPCPPGGYFAVVSSLSETTGWRLVAPDQWTINSTRHMQTDTCPNGIYFPVLDTPSAAYTEYFLYDYWTNYEFIDSQGTAHPLALRTENYDGGGNLAPNSVCLGSTTQSPTLDGSGSLVNLASGFPYNTTNYNAFEKDGRQVISQPLVPPLPFQIRDSNGNFFTATADTLNRDDVVVTNDPNYPAPTSTPPPSSIHQIYTVHDSNGNPQQYLVDFEGPLFRSSACPQNGLDGTVGNQSFSCTETGGPATSLQQLTLPDGKTYVFTYNVNSPGELASITLPSGATINYTYTDFYQISNTYVKGQPPNVVGGRAVASKTVTVDGRSYLWKYKPQLLTNVVTDPDQNVQTHQFSQLTVGVGQSAYGSTSRYETNVTYANSKGAVLRTVQTGYAADFGPIDQSVVNVRPTQVTTTLDNGLVSQKQTDYETFSYACTPCQGGGGNATRLNPTEVREYDYGNGSPGALIRRTDYTYLHNSKPAYVPLNIVDKPASITTYDGSGNMAAQTTYEYDNYSRPTQPMQSSGAVQHASSFGTSYQTRGNPTAVSRWLNTTNSWITSTSQYDDAGNVVSVIDPLGNPTTYSFSDAWSNGSCASSGAQTKAFATLITDALNETVTNEYNSCTGTIAASTDANKNTTSISYDPLNRPAQVSFPDGGTKSYCYTDDPNGNCSSPLLSMITTTGLNSGANTVTTVLYDGLGQVKQTQMTSDPSGVIYADSVTNDRGQVVSASNPYRASSDPTYGVTAQTYDALGRKLVQTNTDKSTVTLSYSGNVTTTTDENQNSWQRTEDALGRLTKVMEPDPVTGVADLETDYTYDVLGNLLTVNQLGVRGVDTARTRSFTYDSLSRLLCASNPENSTVPCPTKATATYTAGTTGYSYDADGNLSTKTDARNVTIGYFYDALNRLVSKSYSGSTTAASAVAAQTPQVNFTYGLPLSNTVPNGLGRLVSETTGPASAPITKRSILQYDPMGRIQNEQQCATAAGCSGTPYAFQYAYDLAGDVVSANNGASAAPISLAYSYDGAARLETISSTWNDQTHPQMLFGPPVIGPQYGPIGLSSAWLGMPSSSRAPAYLVAQNYDQRLRLSSAVDSTSIPGTVSSGSITIGGFEQITTANTHGAGSFTVVGNEGTYQLCIKPSPVSPVKCNTIFDTGTLTVTVNGFQASATYFANSNDSTLAKALAAALNVNGSPVIASSSGTTVTMKSIATGPQSNYGYSVVSTSATNGQVFNATDAGTNFTGGTIGPTVSDSGTLSVTVAGVTAQVPWGSASTSQSIASQLQASLASAGAGVISATVSGDTITLTGSSSTANTPISYTVADAWGAPPSFSASTIGMVEVATGAQLYGYALSYQPNGNLQTLNDSVIGNWAYSYDHLNRALSAQASGNTYYGSALLSWNYDSFGNRKQQTLSGSTQATAAQGSYSYPGSNNQASGFSYDGAGNITQDATNIYTFDAEGRVATVNGSMQYLYDAEGQRVAKLNGTALTNLYLLGLNGEQVTELNGSGGWLHSNVYADGKLLATYDPVGLHYQFADWLGSRRIESLILSSGTPQVEETCKSLPFGDSLICSGHDATEHHFTGKIRDAESGLDYFGERYYASTMGRWMSPDPIWVKDDRLMDPQRLNLYSYVRNNPLTLTDQHGADVILGQCALGSASQCFKQVQNGLAQADRAHVHLVTGDGSNGFAKGVNGITVDQDYKSDSKNFQVLQSLSGDHSATARVDVLNPNDKVTVMIAFGFDAKKGYQYQATPISPGNPSKNDGFEGYTFFPLGEGPGPYSNGNFTDVVANTDSGRGGLPATIQHELRHVFLGDFGRTASKAMHGTGNVDQQTKAAEDEAIRNQKDKP